jgi:signal transduction histidine kinase/CheY-like chemotaxis protein
MRTDQSGQDLQEQIRKLKQDLEVSESRFRNVLSRIADAVIVVDENGHVVFANPSAETLFDRKLEELVGLSFGFPLVVGETTEVEIVRKNNLSVTAEMRVVEAEWDGCWCFLASLRDITDRKKAEEARTRLIEEKAAREKAEESNRLKDEFLTTVSHELRTPLTSILGWARMLRSLKQDPTMFDHAIESIERNARAQTQLIQDLLDISRITTGKLLLNPRPVELIPLIESSVDVIRAAAEAKNISLTLNYSPSSFPVFADPDRIQQILWNLLSNSIKFTQHGGAIALTLDYTNTSAVIRVVDTGIGIPVDFLPFVFERFRQADGSETRSHGGLGLGLSLVRHMVELHGGTVEAYSDGEGRGATFTITLPRIQKREDHRPVTSKSTWATETDKLHLKGTNIVVIDDSDISDLLTVMLTHFGANVFSSSEISEVLDHLKTFRPDLVVADLQTVLYQSSPSMQDLTKVLRKQSPPVPGIALTDSQGVDDRLQALGAGFQTHLSKPLYPEELVTVITSILGIKAD